MATRIRKSVLASLLVAVLALSLSPLALADTSGTGSGQDPPELPPPDGVMTVTGGGTALVETVAELAGVLVRVAAL